MFDPYLPRSPSLLYFIELPIVVAEPACWGCEVRNFTLPSRAQRKLSRLHLDDLTPEAKLRLKWFDWHEVHGQNVSLTCRHFGISRQTFYRWQKRFDRCDLRSLADRSSRARTDAAIVWDCRKAHTTPRRGEDMSPQSGWP